MSSYLKRIARALLKRVSSSTRKIHLNASSNVATQVIAVKIPKGGGASAVRVASSEANSSDADVISSGSIEYSIRGSSRQGEEGASSVCRILIQRLNEDGANWEEPYDPQEADKNVKEQGIDCMSHDGERRLQIQVTRAVTRKAFWQTLSVSSSINSRLTVEQATDELRLAIRKKESVPVTQRKDIVLALDALDTSGHTLSNVVESFRNKYQHEVRALGFSAIWIVGPVVDLTHRLD